jgi:hypothetical protein
MSNLLGALVGALIDRSDGDSGIKGAVVGSLSQRLFSAAIPIVATVVVGWAVTSWLNAGRGSASSTSG